MEFVPYYELSGRPHVVADGSSRRSTVLTLSHWPHSGTPWPLKADLSTEIAYRYLDQPAFHVEADAVSNDHLDLDGFTTVLVLDQPEFALANRELIIEVARAGDFADCRDETARRVAFTIGSFIDPLTSPLGGAVFDQQKPYVVASLYRDLLERLPSIVGDLDRYEAHWAGEEASLAESEAALDAGRVTIEERPEHDLAIVTLDADLRLGRDHRFCLQGYGPVHPLAVHARTSCHRIAYLQGRRYGVVYRFESWVQLTSRRPVRRVDLTGLASSFNEIESADAEWRWGWPGQTDLPVPWLALGDGTPESSIGAGEFVERLTAYLVDGPLVADQYDPEPAAATSV